MSSKFIMKGICIALFFFFTPAAHSDETTIYLWHKEATAKEFINNICAEFSAEYGVRIKAEYIPVNHLKQALIKRALRGRMPEIALVPSDFVGLFSLINLSEVPASLNNPDIGESAYETVRIGGKIYGAPILGGNHIMMYYNKKKVKTPATTWDELYAQKTELEQQGIKTIGWSYNDVYWFVGFMGPFGGWPMEGERITLNTKAMQDTLIFYKSLADKGLIPRDCDSGCGTERFFKGEFAYALNGDWAYLQTEKALGKDFGVAVIPSIGTKPVTPMYSTHALVFPGKSLLGPHRKILEQFAMNMQSEPIQRRWYTALKRLPVHKKVLNEFKQQADQNQRQLLRQLELARAMPSEPSMSYAWEGIRKGFYRFLAGSLDAEQASTLMQKVAESQD